MNYLFKKKNFPKPKLILLLEQEVCKQFTGGMHVVQNVYAKWKNKHIYVLSGKRGGEGNMSEWVYFK